MTKLFDYQPLEGIKKKRISAKSGKKKQSHLLVHPISHRSTTKNVVEKSRITVTNVIIQPDCITLYDRPVDGFRKPKKNDLPKSNRVNGVLSYDSIRRIRYAYKLIYWSSKQKKGVSRKTGKVFKWRLNMITLTLSQRQRHSDQFIRQYLLEPFLRALRLTHKVKHNLWKAERQKNGNIHFHINTSTYVKWQDIRSYWNMLQKKHGYLDNYTAEHGHSDANSTDIHAVRNDREMAGYMVKYMSKNSDNSSKMQAPINDLTEVYTATVTRENQPIRCKIWDCSNTLKIPKLVLQILQGRGDNEITAITSQKDAMFKNDWVRIYPVKKGASPRLARHFRNYLEDNGLLEKSLFRSEVQEFSN